MELEGGEINKETEGLKVFLIFFFIYLASKTASKDTTLN